MSTMKWSETYKCWAFSDGTVGWTISNPLRSFFRRTKGTLHNGGNYRRIKIHGRRVMVHRVIADAYIGFNTLEVDHINRNREDNRPTNLRYVTRSENCRNTIRQDKSLQRFGVLRCEDRRAYLRAQYWEDVDKSRTYRREYRRKRKMKKERSA